MYDVSTSHEPIACSLPLRDATAQVVEWTELHEHATSSEPIPDGFAITYPSELAEIVESLAARESVCCSWLSVTTSSLDEGIRLEMVSDHPDAGPVIALLAGRADDMGELPPTAGPN